MPLFPLIPIAAVAVQIMLAVYIVNVSWIAWIVAPVWLAAGLVVYSAYSRSHALPIREEILTVEEGPAPAPASYRILAPVANPENAVRMALPLVRIAEAKHASVELLHMVTLPDQVPLADAPLYAMEGQEAIVEAMLYVAARFPARASIRYCRNSARGILAEARQRKADLIVLGSRSRKPRRHLVFGSTVDPILRRAACNVAVFRDVGKGPFNSVLVPITGAANDMLALEIASILVTRDSGRITLLEVAPPRVKPLEVDTFLKLAAPVLRCPVESVECRRVVAANHAMAVVREARHFDLVVIGASREKWWHRATRTGAAERIAARTDKPLVMVEIGGMLRSPFGTWL